MPILLILLLVASVLELDWPRAVVPLPPGGSLAATAGLVLLSVAASFAFSLLTAVTLHRNPDHRGRAVRRYGRWRQVAFYLNIAIAAVAVFALGWGDWVQVTFRDSRTYRLLPFAELLVPAPYLLTLALNWVAYWPAEREMFRAAYPGRAFWSLPGFWLMNARQFVVTVMLPVLLCVTHQSATRLFPVTTSQWWYQLAVSFSAVVLATLLPLIIRPLLGLKRLPPGPVRDQLEATARRLGVRFSDLLLWPTRGAMANAMVIGVIPWARYVILTDRLIDSLEPDELDAVFGHEVGHARFGHLPFYLLFLLLSSSAATALLAIAGKVLPRLGFNPDIPDYLVSFLPLPPLMIMGVYLFAVFGWLSRVCERQADIFGCRAGSCGNPTCTGHDADTVLVARGRGLCPTGVRSMSRALERVMVLNGWDAEHAGGRGGLWRRAMSWFRSWQHGPMGNRVVYLLGLIDRPELADRHDRRAFRVRLGIALALIAVIVAGVLIVGKEMLRWL